MFLSHLNTLASLLSHIPSVTALLTFTLPAEAVLCHLHLQLACQLCSLPALVPWPCADLPLQGELQVPLRAFLLPVLVYIQGCVHTLAWERLCAEV